MKYEQGLCQVCGLDTKVVISENKLAKEICASCIVDEIDVDSAADIRDLSLTMRIPFNLNEYYSLMLNSPTKVEAMGSYLDYLSGGRPYEDDFFFDWHEIDQHYDATLSYTRALAEIAPLRDAITERGQEKWGYEHTFQEIIKLEQIYENTVRQYNITSALQQDSVKKAARLSIKMDNLIAANEFKDLKDATSAQAQFLKTANIEDLIASSDDETIRTVADLASYLESNGFNFNSMRPNVEEDEIDLLMDNYVKNVKEIVYNATGLDRQLQDFIENLKEDAEEDEAEEARNELPLDDYEVDDFLQAEEMKLNKELEEEEFEVDFGDEDIYY